VSLSESIRAARFYRFAVLAAVVGTLGALIFVCLMIVLPAPQQPASSPVAPQRSLPPSVTPPSGLADSPPAAKPPPAAPARKTGDGSKAVPLVARTPRAGSSPLRRPAETGKTGRPVPIPRVNLAPGPVVAPPSEITDLLPSPGATPDAAATTGAPSVPSTSRSDFAAVAGAPTGESIAVRQLQQILARYEQAYDRLDASAAAAVWPSVDVRGLERAFARLSQQDLEFSRCVFGVSSVDATVTCSGELRYVRRVGNTAPRVEPHSWVIQFRHVGGEWRIVSVAGK
jgi:hypothetical protein